MGRVQPTRQLKDNSTGVFPWKTELCLLRIVLMTIRIHRESHMHEELT